MIKRLLFAMMFIACFMVGRAQDNPVLPLNPKVLHGTLSNGLNYYILHNEEPKNRANFYIAQKVGSTLETSEQLGLAHFLEHMAFNGTTHFPGKDMLNYLQHKGIRFGSDINAYTSFDETVYNINNVPTNDQALMDSVLLVLADWSGSILLETEEIDAERGVIQGEYTMRNDADTRMLTAILPQLYEEYQYRQMPIGSMEIVKNFPPQALRDYYKKWYRPDLQGIVIVGDFDAQAMEAKVKELFSQIPMPENAAERIYPTISDNQKPIYVTFEDPELQTANIYTAFKFERTPIEFRNTLLGYINDQVISSMVAAMINNRLSEYSQKPECPYSYAGLSIGSYFVSKQKGAVNVVVVPKGDNYIAAYESAMGIITQACKTGFMGTEVQRVRDEILAGAEAQYNERDKTDSDALGRDLIEHFIENEPSTGIEMEYEMLQQFLPMLPEETYNMYASQLLHIDNTAVVITQPTGLLSLPQEEQMLASLNNIINADYEPYVDEVITDPLISSLPAAGKIVSQKDNAEFGTKEYVLSNGVKVVVKPTDFANDEILIEMFKPGGKSSYPESQAASVQGLDLVLDVSNIGPFNPVRLGKYLAGKKVSLNYKTGNSNNYFEGYSTVKDVATLFELLYASFTDVTPDQETFDATMSQLNTFLANQEKSPEYQFQIRRFKDMYPNSATLYPLSIETVKMMNYDEIMKLYKESLQNAADFTLIITGNVDENTIKPLLEQYVATLPSTGVKNPNPAIRVPILPVAGKINDVFTIQAQNPSVYIYDCISQGGMPYNVKNDVMVDLVGDVLYMIYLETIREEMGATYSPAAQANLNPYTSSWQIVWYIITNEDMHKAVIERADSEFQKLLKKGTDQQHFNKVREAAIKQLENEVRTNSYWQGALMLNERGYNGITGRKEILESLTLKEFNSFMKNLYDGKNKIEIVGIAK